MPSQRGWLPHVPRLLNEADGVKTEMRIAAGLNQPRRLFDGFAKPDVLHRDAQQFPARLVILDDTEPEVHGIQRSG